MKTFRKLSFATLSALVSFAVSAAALEVGSGETVDISDSRTYDSVSINGGTIVLKAGGVLRAGGVNVGSADSTITFNGGRLAISGPIKTMGAGSLYLNGNDGDVIVVNENTASWLRLFQYDSGATGRIHVTGNKNFVVTFPRNGALSQFETGKVSSLLLENGGRTEVNNASASGNYLIDNGWGNLFENQEARLGYGVTLNMQNIWHAARELTGAGSVSGAYLRFEVPQNATSKCVVQTVNLNDMIKRGAGRLDVFKAAPTNLIVEAGEVQVLPRSQVGYSEFRLKIDGVGTPAKSGMKLNSFALYSGNDDVTAGYAFASIPGQNSAYADLFMDGTSDRSWWYGYDTNGGMVNPSFDNAYIDVRYNDRRIVTGYKLRTADAGGGDKPKAWRLFGRDSNGEWELLDQQTDATIASGEFVWSSEFSAQIPADAVSTASCGKLSMNSGAKLTVLPNAAFASSAFAPANGAVFDFRAGSSVDIAPADANGAAADLEIAAGSSSLNGALAKSGSGALTLTGVSEANGPEKVHVKEGTLALRSYINWKHWKFVFCDMADNLGTPIGMAINEVAVFDADGNRLNVVNSSTLDALTESSLAATTNARMYDGDDSTYWLTSTLPKPADDTTWLYTSFTLSSTAPSVASYNLKAGGTGAGNSRPKAWKVYARESATDVWVLVDEKTDVSAPGAGVAWYNGGTSWSVAALPGSGAAALGASVPITVDPGATLDLTRANETVISDLVVDGDASGVGTIRGGTCAAEGVVRISLSGQCSQSPWYLPLVLDGVSNTEALSDWTIEVNGRRTRKRLSAGVNGQLFVKRDGLTIIVQ